MALAPHHRSDDRPDRAGRRCADSQRSRALWIAALIVAISVLWRFWTWRRRHYEALRVIAWLWETLYVPIKELPPDETQA